jgi:hypothetical protein
LDAPFRSDANTIRRPSGVQIGDDSTLELEASRMSVPRLRSKTWMSASGSRIVTAMRVPSGERRGVE